MNENVLNLNDCHSCQDRSFAAAVLSADELGLINSSHHEVEFEKGTVFIHKGSLISHIIYLRSGLVKEFSKDQHGHEQIVQIIKKHSYLGLSSMMGDKVNHYSYSALTPVKVCFIDFGLFRQLIRQNGRFAYEILVSVSQDNLNNFHRFMSQAQKKTYGRVADALLYFSQIIYESPEFELPFTRQEFGDLIGNSRESTIRVLSKFTEEGIVEIKGRMIIIRRPELLQQISRHG